MCWIKGIGMVACSHIRHPVILTVIVVVGAILYGIISAYDDE
jgi:hypothetical protein